MKKGKLIVIEGGDGSGKTTQIQKLKDYFGEKIICTREPGGTEFAEAIRSLALTHPLAGNADGATLFLLMYASRAEHMNHLVRPALDEEKIVVSDRFDSSTYAYNVVAQENLDLEEYFWQTREAILGEYKPDLYIYLEVSPEVAQQRLGNGDRTDINHLDLRKQSFHEAMRRGMDEFLKKVPHTVIDANPGPDEVFENVLKAVMEAID